MSDFLKELQNIRLNAIEEAQNEHLLLAKKEFQHTFRQKVEEMEESVQNELRRLVATHPSRTQFHVQRTIKEIRTEPNVPHTYKKYLSPPKPNGMCAFLRSEDRGTFFAEIAALFPWSTVRFRHTPDHDHTFCRPDLEHGICIAWTISLAS